MPSEFQHVSPPLAWAANALATHISSFVFRLGVWGESRGPRVGEGGGEAAASLALTQV